MPWPSEWYIASVERHTYERWCDGLIALEARVAARERARIGHARIDLPWDAFIKDPRCAPGVLVWFDAQPTPELIGDNNDPGAYPSRAWVREMVDVRAAIAEAADLALAPANDLCGGCGGTTPVERALLDVAVALGVDTPGLAGWLERTVSAAKASQQTCGALLPSGRACGQLETVMDGRLGWRCREHTRSELARLTVATNALAAIAADLGVATVEPTPWIENTTQTIRNIIRERRAHAEAQARRTADLEAALRDIGAALGVEDEPLPAIVAAAWEHAGYRTARLVDAIVGGPPTAEHVPFVVRGERSWVPAAGEVFEGRVRRANGVLDERWYRMEWRGWYDDAGPGPRASVLPLERGPLLGDVLEDMRPIASASGAQPKAGA